MCKGVWWTTCEWVVVLLLGCWCGWGVLAVLREPRLSKAVSKGYVVPPRIPLSVM